MAGRLGRGLSGNRGQTLVEFALIVALLLAILFGIIEFGRAWFYSNHINNSVRAAARYAAVLGSTPGGFSVDTVRDYLTTEVELDGVLDPDAIDSAGTTVTVLDRDTGNPKSAALITRGDTIQVTVTYRFQVLSGSIIPFFKGDRLIIRSAAMRYEG